MMQTKKQPNLFIVGAPKCGTTSMWHYLGQHPDIFMVKEKEPQYFNNDLSFEDRPQSLEKYLQMFASASNEKYLGEASPLYLISKNAAQNIYEFAPGAKIIVMLRKPSELIYSIFLQNRVNGVEEIDSFEKALSVEGERKKALKGTINGQPVERLFYSSFASYTDQLKRFYAFFDKEQIQVILFEDLQNDTQAVYERVLDFLNLPIYQNINFEIQNKAKITRNENLQKIIDKPPKVVSRIFRRLFSSSLRSKIYWKLWWLNKKRLNNPSADVDLLGLNRKNLKNIEDLESFLGVDLTDWKL